MHFVITLVVSIVIGELVLDFMFGRNGGLTAWRIRKGIRNVEDGRRPRASRAELLGKVLTGLGYALAAGFAGLLIYVMVLDVRSGDGWRWALFVAGFAALSVPLRRASDKIIDRQRARLHGT